MTAQKHEHKLLVYGTLKRTFYNHHLLKEIAGESIFLSNTRTRFATYYMKENGGFPAVFFKATLGQYISGELYSISDKILQECDELEGHPVWYQRRRVPLIGTDDCYMYVMRDQFIEQFPLEVKIEQNVQRF